MEEVIQKHDLYGNCNDCKNGHYNVDVGQIVKVWKCGIGIISTWQAGHAHKVHREENPVGTDTGYPEMYISQFFVHHSTLEHFREPMINPRQQTVKCGNSHYQVEVGHHKIGVVNVDIQCTVP